MKFIFAFLFCISANAFNFRSTVKDLFDEGSVKSKRSQSPQFYCYDEKGQSFPLGPVVSRRIVDACAKEKKDCESQQHNEACTKISTDKALRFSNLNQLTNPATCKEFADRFLKVRGLGESIDKPSASVNKIIVESKVKTKQPNFQFEILGSKIYGGGFTPAGAAESEWHLTVVSDTEFPTFERNLETQMIGKLPPKLSRFPIRKGQYERKYRFKVVNDKCQLLSMDSTFLAEGSTYTESEVLDVGNCRYLAPNTFNEKKNKLPLRENFGRILCSESIASYSVPMETTEISAGQDKRKPTKVKEPTK